MKTAIEKENSRNKKPTQGKRRKTETQAQAEKKSTAEAQRWELVTGQKKGNKEVGKTGKLGRKTGPSKKRSRELQGKLPTEQVPQEVPAQTGTRSTLKRRRREQRTKTTEDKSTKEKIKIRSTLKRRRVQQLQDTRSTLKRRRKQTPLERVTLPDPTALPTIRYWWKEEWARRGRPKANEWRPTRRG